MAQNFSGYLRRQAARVWQAIERHPFLIELHAGTLPIDRFTYFVLQDYVYLLDFAQVLCHGGAKAPDLATLELFARHALGAVEVERSFHKGFGKTVGLSEQDLDKVSKAPVTQAYITHLQSAARAGSLGPYKFMIVLSDYGRATTCLRDYADNHLRKFPVTDYGNAR